jgi:hypothetical protein
MCLEVLLVKAKSCSVYGDLSKGDDNVIPLVQVHVGSAGKQRDIIFITLK